MDRPTPWAIWAIYKLIALNTWNTRNCLYDFLIFLLNKLNFKWNWKWITILDEAHNVYIIYTWLERISMWCHGPRQFKILKGWKQYLQIYFSINTSTSYNIIYKRQIDRIERTVFTTRIGGGLTNLYRYRYRFDMNPNRIIGIGMADTYGIRT